MQNQQITQGQKVVSPVLDRVAKLVIFVLKRVGAWRPRRHNCTQTSLECPTTRREGLLSSFQWRLAREDDSSLLSSLFKTSQGLAVNNVLQLV